MPQPTNSELFQLPGNRVTRLELLPYPAVTYEEHLNTNFLLSLQRFSLLVKNVLGPVKTNGYDVVVDGTDVKVKAGLLFFREFLVQESSDVVVGAHANEDRKLILKITEVEKTYESHQSDVEVQVEGRSLSGPNQKTFDVEYLYQTGAVPADTSTEKYLHLADIASDETVSKQVPKRDELIHELATGENLVTSDNYKNLNTEIANFFNNKKVDYGSGDELAIFVDPDEASISGDALDFRVEKIESMSYIEDFATSFESKASLFQNGMSNKCKVKFAWGYETTQGTGSAGGSLQIDNAGFTTNTNIVPSFSQDELVGYRVWVDGSFYTVTANTATSGGTTDLTVEDASGNNPDLTGVTIDGSTPVIIDNQAAEYKVIVRHSDGTSSEISVTERRSGSGTPVKGSVFLEMEIGREYTVSLQSFSVLRFDSKTQNLTSADLTQWGSETLTYGASPNFIPQFADIPSLPSATLDQSSDDEHKMKLSISGITPASEDFPQAYEVIWNKNPVGDNSAALGFSAGQFEEKAIIHALPELKGQDKTLITPHGLTRGESRDINLKYRALVGGQAVSSPAELTTSMALSDLSAPQNLTGTFLSHGLYEQDSANDVYTTIGYADRRNNAAAVKVTWDAVTGARGYLVEGVILDSGGNEVAGTRLSRMIPVPNSGDTIGTDGVVMSYQVGRTMRIQVSAIHEDATQGQTASIDFSADPARISAPSEILRKIDENGVRLSWAPVEGADHYEVFWSYSADPVINSAQAPSDQQSEKTKDNSFRINAQSGVEVFVGVISVDKYGRRSLNMERVKFNVGRVSDREKLPVWAWLERPPSIDYFVASGDNELMNVNRFTQPIFIMGISVRAVDGEYYEAGTTTSPVDNQISDHPVKIRVYRQNEPSNNVSVLANALNSENVSGTQTNPDRDALLSVPAHTTIQLDYINEHSSYDLANFKAEVLVFYKYAEEIDLDNLEEFRS